MGVVYLARDPVSRPATSPSSCSASATTWTRASGSRGESASPASWPTPTSPHLHAASTLAAFIAMEYVEGDTLDLVIKVGAPLELQKKLDYMIDLADAMSAAHARRYRPPRHQARRTSSSIRDGRLKVLDFGIARLADAAQTSFSVNRHAQLHGAGADPGEQLDARCDIFAAGVVLFELISYRRPFVADNVQACSTGSSSSRSCPCPASRPASPTRSSNWWTSCLEKQPGRRPQSPWSCWRCWQRARHSLTQRADVDHRAALRRATHLGDLTREARRDAGRQPRRTPRGTPRGTPSRSSASARRLAELRARQIDKLRDEARHALTTGGPEDGARKRRSARSCWTEGTTAAAIELAELARKSVERREASAALADRRSACSTSARSSRTPGPGPRARAVATLPELSDLEGGLDRLERERAASSAAAASMGAASVAVAGAAGATVTGRGAPPAEVSPAVPEMPKWTGTSFWPWRVSRENPSRSRFPSRPQPLPRRCPRPHLRSRPRRCRATSLARPSPHRGPAPAAFAAEMGPGRVLDSGGELGKPVPVLFSSAPPTGGLRLARRVAAEDGRPGRGAGSRAHGRAATAAGHAPTRRLALVAAGVALALLCAAGAAYYFVLWPAPSPGPTPVTTTVPVITDVRPTGTGPRTPAAPARRSRAAGPQRHHARAAPPRLRRSRRDRAGRRDHRRAPVGTRAIHARGFDAAHEGGYADHTGVLDLAPGEYELTLENGGLTRTLSRRIKIRRRRALRVPLPMPGFTPSEVVDQLMGSATR